MRRRDRLAIFVPLLIALFFASACDRHVEVTKQMTWQCLPDRRDPKRPEMEAVQFSYVEDPSYFDIISAQGLCQELKEAGKKIVPLRYDVSGSYWGRMRGYRVEAIDGRLLTSSGDSDGSGHYGDSGIHPLEAGYR